MEKLQDLTKDELISFIINYGSGDINIHEELAACVACDPDSSKSKYYYICDRCNTSLKED
jgi:hypothetical protein